MDLDKYQRQAERTAKQLGSIPLNLMHASLGMCTELGEFVDPIAQGEVEVLRERCTEELGDLIWYVALAAGSLGEPLSRIAAEAFAEQRFDNTLQVGILSLTTAIGDFTTDVKRMVIYEAPFDANRRDTMRHHLAMVLLHARACADKLEVNFDYALTKNLSKLRERFPDRYSNEAAEARADKGGLDAHSS